MVLKISILVPSKATPSNLTCPAANYADASVRSSLRSSLTLSIRSQLCYICLLFDFLVVYVILSCTQQQKFKSTCEWLECLKAVDEVKTTVSVCSAHSRLWTWEGSLRLTDWLPWTPTWGEEGSSGLLRAYKASMYSNCSYKTWRTLHHGNPSTASYPHHTSTYHTVTSFITITFTHTTLSTSHPSQGLPNAGTKSCLVQFSYPSKHRLEGIGSWKEVQVNIKPPSSTRFECWLENGHCTLGYSYVCTLQRTHRVNGMS